MEHLPRQDLQDWMTRLADGDREAFRPVFDILWPLLRSVTARHLPAGDADDAAQEALLKIFFRAADFDPSRSALAWALGITAFEIRTLRKRRARRREDGASVPSALAVPAPSPEDEALQGDLEALLVKALGVLRPDDAETLRLYARGERAAVAAATFRKRVERAMGRLRAAWRILDGRP
jgi:RNA polymerase sigma-70 factor (ECF subfamily)